MNLLCVDAAKLRRKLGTLAGQRASPGAFEQWHRDVLACTQRVQQRRERVPRVTYDDSLPIAGERARIMQALSEHQVVVLCGETGSGKTTQLPKMLLELGRGTRGMIGHTQPRRIAARSVAARIASELGTALGAAGSEQSSVVGYQVRFGDESNASNLIKLMTDGILLSQTQHDRDLLAYDTIIIDEAHERSLNIDFLLGYLRTLLPRRPDLKVVVTSATIDPQRFATHFAGKDGTPAPILQVEGRMFPVEVRYAPLPEEHEEADETDDEFVHHVRTQLSQVLHEVDGDVLMFLSGEREIRELAEELQRVRPASGERIEVLPLYARLSAEEQQRVFASKAGKGVRRIVLATNVAETSVTVPGIRVVIDAGFARVNRYSPRTKVDRLEVERISQASARQRAGRCGRVGPGICIRLYGEEDFASRPAFSDPEIHRENLASVILRMAALHLGEVQAFPFLDPPDPRGVRDAEDTLRELQALDEAGKLTEIGRRLSRLPIDPRLGRIILAGAQEHALRESLVLASALSVQDPRQRPAAVQDKADAAHAQFADGSSDFLGLLRLWREWRSKRRELGGSKLRRWCKEHFLSFVHLREWEDLHEQLRELAEELKLRENREPAKPDAMHRALLAGLLCNIGCKLDKQEDREAGNYAGGRATRFFIHPSSALAPKAGKVGPKWLFAAEVVRTTRTYARTIAPVQPEWIEQVASHLLKKVHTEPRWDRHTGRVVAFEKGLLDGLEVYAKRRVHYGEVNPKESREIFVHHALVQGELESPPPQLRLNMQLQERVHELEARCRRAHLLCDYDTRYRWYEARVPAGIVTAGAFEKWRHEASQKDAGVLRMAIEDLLAPGVTLPGETDFPDELDLGHLRLPLSYVHDTASESDGVTLRTPLDALGQVPQERLAWLVPGLLPEKIDTIVRGLPKDYRRLLPAPAQLAAQASELLRPAGGAGARSQTGSFFDALRLAILTICGHEVPKDVLASVPTPAWMTLRLEVLDEQGKVLASGRDVHQLRSLLASRIKAGLAQRAAEQTRTGIRHWDFGDLPERVELERSGMKFGAFPGIEDARDSVTLRLFDTFDAAQAATRLGSRRLFMLAASDALRRHATSIPGLEQAALFYAPLGSAASLRTQVQELVADRAFLGDMLPVRTEKEFAFRVSRGLERLPAAVAEVAPVVASVLSHAHEARKVLSMRHPPAFEASINDMRDQLLSLVPADFAVTHPFEWLRHVPRYVQGIRLRLQRLPGGGHVRDAKLMEEVVPFVRGVEELRLRQQSLGLSPLKIAELRWHIEEFRVQLFAQELRTAMPVSGKRLQEMWNAIVKG